MPEKKIDHRIEELVLKWKFGHLSATEKAELDLWYASFDDALLIEDSTGSADELMQRLYLSILEKAAIETPVPSLYPDTTPAKMIEDSGIRVWPRVAAAAAIILVLSGAIYLITRKSQTPAVAKTQVHDFAPGGNKAILTLANGNQIILDSARTGQLAQEQNSAVEKIDGGTIRYTATNSTGANSGKAAGGANPATANGTSPAAAASLYNSISTPRGGQYAVTLSDGTKVVLNAASSMRYPTVFTGNDRSVRLSGEAWFEIAPDKLHPFIIVSGDQEVKVLGTQFNLNAYEDEPSVKTTLLTGSVRVYSRSTRQSYSLSPGQQSILTGTNLSISEADIEEATAWKNGYFMFESEAIGSIMRKIARWYDVDIKFDGPLPTDKFNGTVQRFVNVSQVLKKLELTNKVHFNIEGRTIMVRK